ncbi:HNH endonuclease [Chryseobacterium arachidis]|jgi:predicted restriction endonuclease|uniref:HNH endonuclease n=1 Tax=Chryseobacterium arachidis TaxID=1416778 RepID=A0A1M4V377_9FLAO|nr:HNH endonuclease [Chryseobacterium arachidis]SHE63333.1 HNH endonuclease [Chryseobacterium arachidis]
MKTKFNNWLIETKTKITRPDKYSNTITTISNHFKKQLNKDIDLYKVSNANDLLRIKDEYFSYDTFFEKNKTGNRMYSRSLDLYIEFLETNRQLINNTISEIEQVKADKQLTTLEKEAIILSRIGQGKFRDDLIELWKGSCVISKFNDSRFLIASHIKPWKKSTNNEKIDKYNGLLLLPTYDKLFDLGFISFDDNGIIIISNSLTNFDKLGIDEAIRIELKDENKIYLQYHRQEIFKK